MQEITTDLNYLEGTINGRPIAGYHLVQYGETQEYLESLIKEGVMLVYREDNPPEEGKLTLTKPNPDPVDTTVTQSPADKIYADPGLLRLCGPQPRFIINTNTDYLAPVPTKLIALVVFPELPLDEIPTDIAGYFAKFFPNQSLTDTYSDEEIVQLQGALDNFIASRKADTTTDPSYNLEYNSVPADTTVTDTTDTVTVQNAEPRLYGPGNVTFKFNSDYPEPLPTKLIALVVFPELPLDEIPTDIAGYFAKFFPNQSLTDTYSDEEIVQLQRALDSFIASRKADTTTDPSYNLEYNSAPADTTVSDTTDNLTVQNAEPRLYGPGNVTFKFNSDYLESLPTKLIALVVFPELPLDEIPTDIAEYFAKFFPDQSLTETYSDEEIVQLQGALDSFIASRKADTTTDPSYNLEYNTVPADTTVTQSPADKIYADPGLLRLCGPQPQMEDQFKNGKFRQSGYGRGQAFFRFIYDSDEAITPSGYELVRTESWSGPDCTDEQIADIARYIIQNDFYGEQQKALMLEAVDAFLANPKKAQSIFDLTFTSTMDAETEAVQSVQVACAEDGGWRTIGTLNNPDGIDWKYQAGNLTGSGTASVVWHAQELGALGVWTDGTDNWTAVDGWFDANWTMLGCGDFDGDGKDSVLMSLYGGLFYSVDLDGTLASLGDLNWSGWEFGAVGDFAGDGKDDVVLLHRESGTVVLLADGNADSFERLGQLDTSDWNIAGAGDLDGDGKADLLVRQASTGLAGAYASADMSQWSTVTTDYLLA